jgi:hypothetical protein
VVVNRQNEGIALGQCAGRILEAAFIRIGIDCVISAVTLRRDTAGGAGTEAAHSSPPENLSAPTTLAACSAQLRCPAAHPKETRKV